MRFALVMDALTVLLGGWLLALLENVVSGDKALRETPLLRNALGWPLGPAGAFEAGGVGLAYFEGKEEESLERGERMRPAGAREALLELERSLVLD